VSCLAYLDLDAALLFERGWQVEFAEEWRV
jgi:hypothetical protein